MQKQFFKIASENKMNHSSYVEREKERGKKTRGKFRFSDIELQAS